MNEFLNIWKQKILLRYSTSSSAFSYILLK